VIVVDDGSTDGTRALATESRVVTVVLPRSGDGPATARNVGAAVASGDKLAFLDADCTPAPGWLAAGMAALEHADLVLGEVRPDPDQALGPLDRTLWVAGVSPLFESASLFIRRELFESLGGFESWLGQRSGKELGEDVLLGWRARGRGARIEACPAALAHHAVFPRGVAGFARERWRLRFFPALARRVPELRTELFCARVFLSKRSLAFDAAALGVASVGFHRRRARAALLGAAPYALLVVNDLKADGARVAAARVLADTVGAIALAYGSVRSRSLLM